MYVITGATGNTGKRISHALLDAGKQVRVIGRSADRLQEFAAKGADVFVGEVNDSVAMEQAFAGASAAYIMIPLKPDVENVRAYQNQVVDSLASAVERSDVNHVVTLSSYGADKSEGTGPVAGLYDMEQRLNQLTNVNVLHVRAGYFMENTLGMAGMVKEMGFIGGPLEPDVRFNMIATQDIADFAAKSLIALDFSGHSHQELQGQRELAFPEVARILGAKIGKPDLQYTYFQPAQTIEGMMQMGVSKAVAESMVELSDGMKSGIAAFREPRSEANTTPTSIEQFAETWTAVYNVQE